MRNRLPIVLVLIACGGTVQAATPHVDDFAADAMGWSVGPSGTPPEWQSDGGPMGSEDGYLRVFSSSNLSVHNNSTVWTGDFTAIGAISISVDVKNEVGSAPVHLRLVLFGSGGFPQSADRWTSSVAAIIPADGVWQNYTFSLAQNDLTKVLNLNGGSYEEMFTSVVQVMLRHDLDPPSSGGESVSATLGIDNVRLAAAPLPGDYNLDGEVDLDDYHTWRGKFGTTDSAADGNESGTVDTADYVFWRDRFAPSVVEVQTVPELATLPLACIAAIGAKLLRIAGSVSSSKRTKRCQS